MPTFAYRNITVLYCTVHSALNLTLLMQQVSIPALQIIVPECEKRAYSTALIVFQVIVEKWHFLAQSEI